MKEGHYFSNQVISTTALFSILALKGFNSKLSTQRVFLQVFNCKGVGLFGNGLKDSCEWQGSSRFPDKTTRWKLRQCGYWCFCNENTNLVFAPHPIKQKYFICIQVFCRVITLKMEISSESSRGTQNTMTSEAAKHWIYANLTVCIDCYELRAVYYPAHLSTTNQGVWAVRRKVPSPLRVKNMVSKR